VPKIERELLTVEEAYARYGYRDRQGLYRALRTNPAIPRVWLTRNALRIPRTLMQRWVEEEAARKAEAGAEAA
jgi:hypothetical protein